MQGHAGYPSNSSYIAPLEVSAFFFHLDILRIYTSVGFTDDIGYSRMSVPMKIYNRAQTGNGDCAK